MADVITQKSSVSATIQQLVSSQVQMVLVANVVVPGTITDYPAGPGMDTLKIPRIGKFTVATKVAATAVSAQTNVASTDDLVLNQHKVVQFLVEDIAGVQSNIDVMGQYLEQAGKDMAVEMDNYFIGIMAAGASAAAPDHQLAFASGTALTKADILLARQRLNEQNVPQDERCCLISPANEAAILSIQEFTRVNEAGSAAGLRNGEFGKLFGFTFLLSTQVADAGSLFYHKSAVASGRQIMPKVEYFRDVPMLADRWSISHLYGGKILDSGKRIVEIGTA